MPVRSVSHEDVLAAAQRLAPVAHRTPVLTSHRLDELTSAQVFLKAEHLQKTGSFKIRGAYNAIAALPPAERRRGVVAFSSGNHAQAVAHAAALHDIDSVIVMPHDAPVSKRRATEEYGAHVIEYRRGEQDREAVAAEVAARHGRTLIRPFDDPAVIAGQGTCADELFETVGELDLLIVCVGGGGLISGCATAASARSPHCRVVGVEPCAGDDVKRSLAAGEIVEIDVPDTIADGQMTTSPGRHTFTIMQELVSDIVLVTDDQIVDAMRFAASTLKQVLEPSGASALAALLAGAIDVGGGRVGVTLSGGNIDLRRFGALVGHG